MYWYYQKHFISYLVARYCGKYVYCDEIWGFYLSLWYQKLFSHVFFLDPETFLCLFLLLSWLFFCNLFLPFSLSHLHPNLFSFLHLPGFYAAWKSHNINECESVSGKEPTSLSLNPYSGKTRVLFKPPRPPPNVVAVLCLAQPKLPETQHPLPRSLPLKKWFFQQDVLSSDTSRCISSLVGFKWGLEMSRLTSWRLWLMSLVTERARQTLFFFKCGRMVATP